MTIASCGVCWFFRTGFCVRNVPTIIVDKGSFWPRVKETDWCGDFSTGDPHIYAGSTTGPQGVPGHSDLNYGTTTIDFGVVPTSDVTVAVNSQPTLGASAKIQTWIQGDALAQMMLRLTASAIAGVGFSLRADSLGGLLTGTVAVNWCWSNG